MSELDELIQFWKNHLFYNQHIMNPTTIYLIVQTIKHLEELELLKKGG